MRKILVIEDDPAIGRGLKDALEWGGFEVRLATTGPNGLQMALEATFDLILLDLALPGMDGIEVLGEIRETRPLQAIIILTARGSESDRVRGLNLGADDYVIKPFSMHELLARVEAVLRRVPSQAGLPPILELGSCAIDFANHIVRHATGESTRLSQRECDLLQYLAHHHHRVVTREELLQKVWGISMSGSSTRTIDMHVVRLREKLRGTSANEHSQVNQGASPHQDLLTTVHGLGYQLQVPASLLDQPIAEGERSDRGS